MNVIFDGKNLTEFNAYCFHKDVDKTPEPEYEEHYINGRKGALLINTGKMNNVERSYDLAFVSDAQEDVDDLKAFLLSRNGYCRLETSLYPDEYYMAVFKDVLEPAISRERGIATVVVKFECLPQRFLKSGETSVTVTTTLENPTLFPSKPIIRVYGNGTLNVNDIYITVASSPYEYVDIDCELMDCYHGSNNANQYVSFSTTDYVTLRSGTNSFVNGGFESVEVTPRWYKL